jgi:hypothetical protein
VVAKQVAREGISGEMWVCLKLNDLKIELNAWPILSIHHPR